MAHHGGLHALIHAHIPVHVAPILILVVHRGRRIHPLTLLVKILGRVVPAVGLGVVPVHPVVVVRHHVVLREHVVDLLLARVVRLDVDLGLAGHPEHLALAPVEEVLADQEGVFQAVEGHCCQMGV